MITWHHAGILYYKYELMVIRISQVQRLMVELKGAAFTLDKPMFSHPAGTHREDFAVLCRQECGIDQKICK
jgi:hypothetical protein